MKKIILFASLAALLTAVYGYFLPESITIEQGKSRALEFSLPLRASVSGGDVQVLNINNAPASINQNFDASGSVLSANESGKMDIELSLLGVPLKSVSVNVLPLQEYAASGETVGIVLDTDGVLVLGTGKVKDAAGNVFEPCRGLLHSGDMIKSINGKRISSKEELLDEVRNSPFIVKLNINNSEEVSVRPIVSADGTPMIGLWVRDSTQGIGTVTYFRKADGAFGALGHPVNDIDTGELMQIKEGRIYPVEMDGIVKGEKGMAGELAGRNITDGEVLGFITKNCHAGVYGSLTSKGKKFLPQKTVPIALKERIHKGSASILSDIDGKGVKEYKIEVESINILGKNTTKGMVIRVTDPKLIESTGGIVQGMSGSPILQDGCLIGAVTHVFVNDPTKGYGTFIETMLAENERQ